ncbi:hypothetical protein [Fulvivirga sp.]|uniref:hypothetical protein n=1 Tax=Fulvivirga sp. TaxID=1931237 RepID=UPI0032F02278
MINKNWLRILRISGVVIMLIAFPLMRDYPWYYGVLLFDIGLALVFLAKWIDRNKLAINQSKS